MDLHKIRSLDNMCISASFTLRHNDLRALDILVKATVAGLDKENVLAKIDIFPLAADANDCAISRDNRPVARVP